MTGTEQFEGVTSFRTLMQAATSFPWLNDGREVVGCAGSLDGSAFIPDPDLAQADVNRISGASGIVADDKGTIYAADVGRHRLIKYVKVK